MLLRGMASVYTFHPFGLIFGCLHDDHRCVSSVCSVRMVCLGQQHRLESPMSLRLLFEGVG